MPLYEKKTSEKKGSLFVVATPIGNMEDITYRAIRILSSVDLVIAEDTRLTGRLLSYYKIKTKLLSMNEHNEISRTSEILARIDLNMDVALVSSAGTPLISDPGFKLLREAIKNSIDIVPIPGVSAVIASMSVSGLPTDSFIFLGFPARKKGKRLEQLKRFLFESKTLIFYESPKRIVTFLNEVLQVLGDRYVVLSREMTKIHEEFIRGKVSSVLTKLGNKDEVKGECTLLISGDFIHNNITETNDVLTTIKELFVEGGLSTSDLSKLISNRYGLRKSKAYNMILEFKKSIEN